MMYKRLLLVCLAVLAGQHKCSCSGDNTEGMPGLGDASIGRLGRCLREPVVAGAGAVVLYDIVVNLQSMRVFFVGPHRVLWIVPATPVLQEKTVPFLEHFGEGRDMHWLPRRQDAASVCDFVGGEKRNSDAGTGKEITTYVSIHGDPYAHVNLASCPLPAWAAEELQSGREVTVQLALAPKPLFQALPCTESNGSHVGACEACRQLVARQAGTHIQPDVEECYNSSLMAARYLRLPPLNMCLPPSLPHVEMSLCCIMKNEARYLPEWIEYSKLVGVSRFYLYDHNSTDNTHEILAPYISSGTVVLHNWSFEGYPQKEVHTHCTHRYAHQTTWLGLMDVDEFLVPVKAATVLDILEASSGHVVSHPYPSFPCLP